jgi:hypothetical protein
VSPAAGAHPLPPDVVWRPDGGLEVRTRRGWRALAVVIGVGGCVFGLLMLTVSYGLTRLGVDAGPFPWVGVAFVLGSPLVAIAELRGQRAETWVVDRDGLRGGGPAETSVRWAEVALLHLEDRHTRLAGGVRPGGGPRPWVRLVTVTVQGPDGTVLLKLPDENHDGRFQAVFGIAAEQGWIPPHVRYEERRDGRSSG